MTDPVTFPLLAVGTLDGLTALEELRREFIALRASLDLAVLKARHEGATWVEIATALGVTRQAATKRFRHLEENA